MAPHIGPQRRDKLNARSVAAAARVPGFYSDGKGLNLRVRSLGSASWIMKWSRGGRQHSVGLGAWPDVSLALARELAAKLRTDLALHRDPIAERKRDAAMTFAAVAGAFIEVKAAGWSPKQAALWRATLRDHASALSGLSVASIDVPAILDTLSPIWLKLPDTARKLRQRIEAVLDYAAAHGYRHETNPAGKAILNLLPAQARNVEHLAAMSVASLPAFMARLRAIDSPVARALEFTILTAARASMVLGAQATEFDLPGKLWTIPAARMKAGRLHVVPLSDAALACLPLTRVNDKAMRNLLADMGEPVTVHGFRSTFRDWAAENGVSRDVAELALAHPGAGSAVEAAYYRSDLLDRRRVVMAAFADYCAGKVATADNVVQLRA